MIGRNKTALAAALAATLLRAAVALATPETEVVERFNASLLGLLGGDSDFPQRFAEIEPAVRTNFDLPFMSARVLGRGWKDLTPEQRELWMQTFTRLTASNYAGRFVGEAGPSFQTLGQEESSQGTVLVRTRLRQPGDEDVDLTYRLRKTPQGWRVIDCYFKGTVSEVALRRSEYGSVLRREGFEALVTAVNRKSDELAAGRGE